MKTKLSWIYVVLFGTLSSSCRSRDFEPPVSGRSQNSETSSLNKTKVALVDADPECFAKIANYGATDSFSEANKFTFGIYQGQCFDVGARRPFRFVKDEVFEKIGIKRKDGFTYVTNFKYGGKTFGIAEFPNDLSDRDLEIAIFFVPLSGMPHNHYGFVITNRSTDKPLVTLYTQPALEAGEKVASDQVPKKTLNQIFLDVMPHLPVGYNESKRIADANAGNLSALRRLMDQDTFVRIYKMLSNAVERKANEILPKGMKKSAEELDNRAIQNFKKLTLNFTPEEIGIVLQGFVKTGHLENDTAIYKFWGGLSCSTAIGITLDEVRRPEKSSDYFMKFLTAANPYCPATAIAAKFAGYAKWTSGFVPLIEDDAK